MLITCPSELSPRDFSSTSTKTVSPSKAPLTPVGGINISSISSSSALKKPKPLLCIESVPLTLFESGTFIYLSFLVRYNLPDSSRETKVFTKSLNSSESSTLKDSLNSSIVIGL